MHRPWKPERIVTAEEAAQWIAAQFLELKPVSVRAFSSGWDNTAYLVNDGLVFRFPRRQVAVQLLETECHVLPQIAAHLPLSVPQPRWVGAPTKTYPCPFAGYPLLPGTTACRAKLSEAQHIECARPLGAFLSALHGLRVDDERIPLDDWDRLNMAKRIPECRRQLENLEQNGVISSPRPWIHRLETTEAPAVTDQPKLVHGDLYARHILVDEGLRPTGVIDWGDVHVGDPSLDLALAFTFLPPEGRDTFWQAYGPISEPRFRLARLRAIIHAVASTAYAYDIQDEALFTEGRKAMDRALR